jgi:hypothetical protein
MTLAVLVLMGLCLIAGYVAGRADHAETEDVARRVLDALEAIYESRPPADPVILDDEGPTP